MDKFETVIFDLGGVLIDWNPRYVFNNVFDSKEEVDFFLENVCHGDWNAQQDKGRSFEEAIEMKIKEFPEYKDHIPLYHSRWTEMIGGPIDETVSILKELFNQRKMRLYALTNWSAETFPYAWDNFPFLRLFEGILVSGKENMIKPEAEIYQLILNRYQIDPKSSVFIDDSERNVEGANSQGIYGIHFKSPQQLRDKLVELSIL
jgi:2-haloacid dehalogenase